MSFDRYQLRTPKVGIVCGSGLAGLATSLADRVEVSYSDITGFGESTGKTSSSSGSAGDKLFLMFASASLASERTSKLFGVRISGERTRARRCATWAVRPGLERCEEGRC